MSSPVPDNAHDAALWLLQNLESVGPCSLEPEVRIGVLPQHFNFRAIDEALRRLGQFYESGNPVERTIRFLPASAGVYSSLQEMLSAQVANQAAMPSRFTLLDIAYEHGRGDEPLQVRAYRDATLLCASLRELKDFASKSERIVHLTLSAEKKLNISLDYTADQVQVLDGVGEVWSQYVKSDTHAVEKIMICRKALFDVFKGATDIAVRDVISRFGEWLQNIRASYAMFMEKFSSDALRAEVERQNSDDMLRLNKTFSEIQNQLLAVPAALLLVGGGVSPENRSRNLSILLGVAVFLLMMWLLIRNQENTLRAIVSEISLRQSKLQAQPIVVSAPFDVAFRGLEHRAKHQFRILRAVRWSLVAVGMFVVFLVVDANFGGALLRCLIGLLSDAVSGTLEILRRITTFKL